MIFIENTFQERIYKMQIIIIIAAFFKESIFYTLIPFFMN
jgi:hypothetical protein